MSNNIIYVIVSFILMYVLRKTGWYFSKKIYVKFSYFLTVIFCIVWGYATALIVGFLIFKYDPNIVVKIIFGYAMGAYMSIPNFGLLSESSVPLEAQKKHKTLSSLPLIIYIVVLVIYAFAT